MAEEIKELTPTGRIQKPAYNVIAQWVKKAWDNIDPALIRRSFKYCGISNNRDGSEDRQIFDFNSLERHNSTSHVFAEENSSEGSSELVRMCEGSNQSVREGVGEFNDVVLDLGDENYDEYYDDMEVDNYVNTWF